ncbi:hypothetical protein [Streptomyces globisporus]|uniref:hypothetical protein n=1 Tax=Streptomyces globisporus TaxID=1908 RepID=UPI0037CAA100
MRNTQMKMTYGKHSVYSEPFSVEPPPSPEVLNNIQDELNKWFVEKVDIPIGAEIECEFVEATMATGMWGFFKTVQTDATTA